MDTAVFDRYRAAWNNHDVDALVEFFTDDGVIGAGARADGPEDRDDDAHIEVAYQLYL